MATPLNGQARLLLAAVLTAGVACAIYLGSQATFAPGQAIPTAILGALALLSAPFCATYGSGQSRTRVVFFMVSAYGYALFLLVNPAVAAIVLVLATLIEKWSNRRGWITSSYNAAQYIVAISLASLILDTLAPGFDVARPTPRSLAVASFAILSMGLANHLLVLSISSVANRRNFFRWNFITRTAVLLELLCAICGIAMALLWAIHPGLLLFAATPVWTTTLLLLMLNHREQALVAREQELSSVQRLGLELGSELNGPRLRQTILRAASEVVHAGSAIIGERDPATGRLRVTAYAGLDPAPPEQLSLAGLGDEFFRAEAVLRVSDMARQGGRYRGFALLDATGALFVPLELDGPRAGLLALFHGPDRSDFDANDERRLSSLMRYVAVAVSNARLVARIQTMQAELAHNERMSALGMLVSGVAHELNNPLTSILGYAELLGQGESDVQRRHMLDQISGQTRRAGKVVRSLLTFSRKDTPQRSVVELGTLLDEVVEFRAYEQGVHNIRTEVSLTPGLPRLCVDAQQLQQVLLNLVTNAEQAILETGRGGCIRLRAEQRDDRVRIDVTDDGVGIRPEDQDRVFLPFFTTKDVGRGTGLGLSICYGIVREHGGDIRVASDREHGTTFTVEIPIRQTATESTQVEVGDAVGIGQRASPPAIDRGAGTLLIVDDEPAIVDMVTRHFQARGWEVECASDGAEALRRIGDRDLDVLLVDLRMPGMDGQAFYRELQRVRPDLVARVIFATGDLGDPASVDWLRESGRRLVGKPFSLTDLEATVATAVPSRRSDRSA